MALPYDIEEIERKIRNDLIVSGVKWVFHIFLESAFMVAIWVLLKHLGWINWPS